MSNVTAIHKGRSSNRRHFIVEWAERRQLKRAEVARELGVDKGTVTKWFKGTVPSDLWIDRAGDLTFIVTAHGKPHTANGFGNWFREQCDSAGLPERCSSHGLRKARATILAEGGASAFQLMSRLGWTNTKQAELYTRKADRRRLAEESARFDGFPPMEQVGKPGRKA